ncbi:hypothetical protein ABK040_003657 [Willaertia magna]
MNKLITKNFFTKVNTNALVTRNNSEGLINHITKRYSSKRSVGIVGMPNVGKSTLFNALTESQKAAAANFPFCTIEPNVGVCTVPDVRLAQLAEKAKTKKIVPTYIEVIDIAGLIKGASEGKGLGNKFLSHVRGVNCIAQMVRCFKDENIAHVENTVDPIRDVQIIESELILSDLDLIERNRKRKENLASKDKSDLLEKCYNVLIEEKPLNTITNWSQVELNILKQLNLLTTKKILYVCNVDEQAILSNGNEYTNALKEYLKEKKVQTVDPVIVCAQLESEAAQCDPEYRAEMLKEYGLKETGLQKLVLSCYQLLDLITFYTVGVEETRAWTVTKGSTAPEAASEIHTDIQKGFIKAETCNWQDFLNCDCDEVKAKKKGIIRPEDHFNDIRMKIIYLSIILLFLSIYLNAQTTAPGPKWCPALSLSQNSYSLCSNQNIDLTKASWCYQQNFRSSIPITFKDPEIKNCKDARAKCFSNFIQDDNLKASSEQRLCLEDVDLDNPFSFVKEVNQTGKISLVQDDKSINYNRVCYVVYGVKPIEFGISNAAKQYITTKQVLFVLTNTYAFILDMANEALLASIKLSDTTFYSRVAHVTSIRLSDTKAQIFIGSKQTIQRFTIELEVNTGNMKFTNDRIWNLITEKVLTDGDEIQQVTSVTYNEPESTIRRMVVFLYGDMKTTFSSGLLLIDLNDVVKPLRNWPFAAKATEQLKIYAFTQGAFDMAAINAQTTIGCHKTSFSRGLLLIYSTRQISIVQIHNQILESFDIYRKSSIIYTHYATDENIYAVSAFTECFGSVTYPSQMVWLSVAYAKTTADSSTGTYSSNVVLLNLGEFAKVDISKAFTLISNNAVAFYYAGFYDFLNNGGNLPADTDLCSTGYDSKNSVFPKMYSGIGSTCAKRAYRGPQALTHQIAVPKQIEVGFYRSAQVTPSIEGGDMPRSLYHLLFIASRGSIEVFYFQELACVDTSKDVDGPTTNVKFERGNLLYTDSKVKEMTVSANGQHLFLSLSKKIFEISSRERLVSICQQLTTNSPYTPDQVKQFSEICRNDYPEKYSIFDYIGYFSMCNYGFKCPRFGDLGVITTQQNQQSADSEFTTVTPGTHIVRPLKTYTCEKGFYCPDNSDGRRRKCASGMKCDVEGLISPNMCQVSGDFSKTCEGEGNANEVTCTKGKICFNPVNSQYVSPGFYSKKARKAFYSCELSQYCPLGTNGEDDAGNKLTNLCPGKTFCETAEVALPTSCVTGAFNGTFMYCPVGSYGSQTHKCPQEYYCPTVDTAILCEDGYYCPEGTQTPNPCPAGYYCPTASAMILCPLNFACPEGSTSPRRCQFLAYCPPGSTKEQNFYLGILLLLIVLVVVLLAFIVVRCVTMAYKKKKMKKKTSATKPNIQTQQHLHGDQAISFENEEGEQLGIVAAIEEPLIPRKHFTMDMAFQELAFVRKKTERVLFEGCTGKLYHGRTTCIVGVEEDASLALLHTLAGHHHYGFVHGKIFINEQLKDTEDFRNVVGLVPAQVSMPKELKVHELLRFCGHARCPKDFSYSQVGKRVEDTCKLLGIENYMYDSIGISKKHGLDEDVRILVNIAMELVHDPTCLLLENVFDQISSLSKVKALAKSLKVVAESGTLVAATLKRPRYDLFQMFDDCIILGKNGSVVYNGPTSEAVRYFDEIGFKCPGFENPPDFFLDVCMGNVEREGDLNFEPERLLHFWDLKKEEINKKWNTQRFGKLKREDETAPSQLENMNNNTTGDIMNTESALDDDEEIETSGHLIGEQQDFIQQKEVMRERQRRHIDFLGQYLMFTLRALLQLGRHYKGVFFDFFFHFIVSVLIGAFYFNMDFQGPISSKLQEQCPIFVKGLCALPRVDKIGPMSLLTISGLAIASMQSALKCFGSDKELYRREAQNGINKLSYFFGKLTGQLPSLIIYPLIYCTFWFGIVNPRAEFYVYYGLFMFVEFVFSCLGYAISVWIQRAHNEFVGVLYILLSALLGGIQPTVRVLSKEWYSLVLSCLSPIRWFVELMYTIEVRKYQESNQSVDSALEHYGFTYRTYYIAPVILFCIGLVFIVLAYIGLILRDPYSIDLVKTVVRLYWRRAKKKIKKLQEKKQEVENNNYQFKNETVDEIGVLGEDEEESESDSDDEILFSQTETYQPPTFEGTLISNRATETSESNNVTFNSSERKQTLVSE